jgi:hypothetical protein
VATKESVETRWHSPWPDAYFVTMKRLDAEEGHGVALDLRGLDDLEVDAGLAGVVDVPGAGDPVGGLTAREEWVAVSPLIFELISAFLVHLLIMLEFLRNWALSTPDLVRVQPGRSST